LQSSGETKFSYNAENIIIIDFIDQPKRNRIPKLLAITLERTINALLKPCTVRKISGIRLVRHVKKNYYPQYRNSLMDGIISPKKI
jgi:Ribonuclease G/E